MFVIDLDNAIYYTAPGLNNPSGSLFDGFEGLLAIAEDREWSKADVTAIWNGFAGTAGFADCKPAVMFRNRPYGLNAIWKAIQRLVPANAATEPAEPAQAIVGKGPEVEKTKKKTAKKSAPKETVLVSRATGKSKKDQAVAMLLRKSGATAEEIVERLGWSKVSVAMLIQWVQLVVRAEIKALAVEKNSKGERVYKAVA